MKRNGCLYWDKMRITDVACYTGSDDCARVYFTVPFKLEQTINDTELKLMLGKAIKKRLEIAKCPPAVVGSMSIDILRLMYSNEACVQITVVGDKEVRRYTFEMNMQKAFGGKL